MGRFRCKIDLYSLSSPYFVLYNRDCGISINFKGINYYTPQYDAEWFVEPCLQSYIDTENKKISDYTRYIVFTSNSGARELLLYYLSEDDEYKLSYCSTQSDNSYLSEVWFQLSEEDAQELSDIFDYIFNMPVINEPNYEIIRPSVDIRNYPMINRTIRIDPPPIIHQPAN